MQAVEMQVAPIKTGPQSTLLSGVDREIVYIGHVDDGSGQNT
jgi:hypothetical protein